MSQVSLPELSDFELVQLCQERRTKDDRPFQELFHRYQALIWRVCYSYTRNPQEAEDLTQEVFFKIYRGLAKFEGRSSFKTWIYRIAFNTAQNEIRRRNSRPQHAETDVEKLAEILPSDSDVETEWLERKEQELLAQTLAKLQPEEYEILHMKDLEQRPYAEIADIMGINLSAAKMRVLRARQSLQAIYLLLENQE